MDVNLNPNFENMRRKRIAQNQMLAQSLAAGLNPNKAPVTAQQLANVNVPKIVRFQLPDGNILESTEERFKAFSVKNPGIKLLGVSK